MDLEARPLRCFIAAAELSSFSRAAKRMNVSQPALSATIKELERRLGFALFDRSGRTIHLTPEGKLFLGNAYRYVRESDILQQASQEIRSTDLRISAAFHTSLIDERNRLLAQFLLANPDVNLEVLNHHHSRGWEKLAKGDVHLLISVEPNSATLEHERHSVLNNVDIGVARIKLATRPVSLLIPREHPLARRPDLTLADVEDVEIVVPNRFHGQLTEQVRFALAEAGAKEVRAPEGSALGLAWYAAMRRLPAIGLTWFAPPPAEDNMILRSVDGLGDTALSLIKPMGNRQLAAERMWEFASQRAECRPSDPSAVPAGIVPERAST